MATIAETIQAAIRQWFSDCPPSGWETLLAEQIAAAVEARESAALALLRKIKQNSLRYPWMRHSESDPMWYKLDNETTREIEHCLAGKSDPQPVAEPEPQPFHIQTEWARPNPPKPEPPIHGAGTLHWDGEKVVYSQSPVEPEPPIEIEIEPCPVCAEGDMQWNRSTNRYVCSNCNARFADAQAQFMKFANEEPPVEAELRGRIEALEAENAENARIIEGGMTLGLLEKRCTRCGRSSNACDCPTGTAFVLKWRGTE